MVPYEYPSFGEGEEDDGSSYEEETREEKVPFVSKEYLLDGREIEGEFGKHIEDAVLIINELIKTQPHLSEEIKKLIEFYKNAENALAVSNKNSELLKSYKIIWHERNNYSGDPED